MSAVQGVGQYYKYIVVGCGGIGSATVYWLSKRSESVLGLDQFTLGHHNGGSQDVSRLIRLGYFDDKYAKLTPYAYTAWNQIERESGLQVVFETGLLILSKRGEGDSSIENEVNVMDRNGYSYERLNNEELRQRFPQFTIGANAVAMYEKKGGFVNAALANAIHIQLARGNGATILENCGVTRLNRAENGNVVVHTTKGIFQCRRLLVTAGAWLNHVLGSIGVHIPVTVTQEQVTYFATPHMKEFTKHVFPAWSYIGKDHSFYSGPIHGNSGVKIGIDAAGPEVTPDTRTFEPDPIRLKMSIDLLKKILPKSLGPILETKTCLYTMTPDRDFVIDFCAQKGWSDVIVCCGAGHAFKFASLLGKILSELAIDGRTGHDISYFTMNRKAITDPNFKPHSYAWGPTTSSKL